MVELFSGLNPRLFAKFVRQLRREGADPAPKGRPWGLGFEDRLLLVAAYCRTNLTMRQLAALFGISNSAADRVIDDPGPKLALRLPWRSGRRGDGVEDVGRNTSTFAEGSTSKTGPSTP